MVRNTSTPKKRIRTISGSSQRHGRGLGRGGTGREWPSKTGTVLWLCVRVCVSEWACLCMCEERYRCRSTIHGSQIIILKAWLFPKIGPNCFIMLMFTKCQYNINTGNPVFKSCANLLRILPWGWAYYAELYLFHCLYIYMCVCVCVCVCVWITESCQTINFQAQLFIFIFVTGAVCRW